jgi:fimbrial chaperone protein
MKKLAMIATLMAAALWLPSSFAGSFSVSPVRADFSPTTKSVALTLRNEGDEPVAVQAEIFKWQQPNGEQQLTPSRDLVVSPALFELKPGERQVIRVILRKVIEGEVENTYRLILQEVPKSGQTGINELTVLLRISLPVFVLPANPVSPSLSWSLITDETQAPILQVRNSGGQHTRLFGVSVFDKAGKVVVSSKEPSYLLVGESLRWALPLTTTDLGPNTELRIEGKSEEGEIAANVAVSK